MWLGILAVSCAAMMYLVILGSSDPEQRALEDWEQTEYLKQYRDRQNSRRRGHRTGKSAAPENGTEP